MAAKLKLGTWADLGRHALAIRLEVFVVEQGVPLEMEQDEWDNVSQHVVAYDENGEPIATGRLLPDGHIGRMAVLRNQRGRGLGRRMLERLCCAAQQAGLREVVLHAQSHALRFYQRAGFVAEGAEFMEAGIAHQMMRKTLDGACSPAD